jgi:cytochrome c-type biogenesis protein CcmH
MTMNPTLRARRALLTIAALALLVAAPAALAQDTPLPAAGTVAAIDAPNVTAIVGPPSGPPLAGAALEEKTTKVAALLRCPVCQGLSVNDSPAAMAVNMKGEVRDLVAKGYDQDQILTYFERSYGEFVRLNPKMEGINWLVWLAPLLILAVGGVVVYFALKQLRSRPATATATEEQPAEESFDPDVLPDDPRLARYVLEVREIAYGWPGGVSPEGAARRAAGQRN